MPTLIAVVTAEGPVDKIAAFLQYALRPGSEHVYGSNDTNLAVGTITVDALEIRHPDGDHYRDKATGQFASAEDEAERPGEVEHEAGDVRRPPASRGAVTVTDSGAPPVDLGDIQGYDGSGAQ